MSSHPLVSVITPSYNQAAFLEQTIQSVLKQDYEPIEYILVDGASEDSSLEIINRYADRLSWWVSESDSGQAEAINKGLVRAAGDIIAWINSDDIYLPGAVTQAVELMNLNPEIALVYSDAVTIDAHGQPLNFLSFGDWSLPDLAAFRIICQPAVFMRREYLLKAGCLDPSYHFLLDHNLWVRIAMLAGIKHASPQYMRAQPGGNGQYSGLWAAARHHPGAKNVAQPSAFAKETSRLLEWMERQPGLELTFQENHNRIYAGAFRLKGRYYLDGGQPKEALDSYWKALRSDPRYTLKHLHRILYALVYAAAGETLANQLMQFVRRDNPIADKLPGLKSWPEPRSVVNG